MSRKGSIWSVCPSHKTHDGGDAIFCLAEIARIQLVLPLSSFVRILLRMKWEDCKSLRVIAFRSHKNKIGTMLTRMHLIIGLMALTILAPCSVGLSLSSFSKFHGTSLEGRQEMNTNRARISSGAASLSMRKQKASDRRTRRLQRGGEEVTQDLIRENLRNTITSSPMELTGAWNQKQGGGFPSQMAKTGGRGRSRKRASLYNSLSSYHNKFFTLLTAEYQAEVREDFKATWCHIGDSLESLGRISKIHSHRSIPYRHSRWFLTQVSPFCTGTRSHG